MSKKRHKKIVAYDRNGAVKHAKSQLIKTSVYYVPNENETRILDISASAITLRKESRTFGFCKFHRILSVKYSSYVEIKLFYYS